MAIDADPDLVHSFEARIINNFFERLQILVHPEKFDLHTQLSMAFQEEQYKMANWRETHGLPTTWPPTRENLAATPPMPVPFIDHQFYNLENSFSTSGGESETNFNSFSGWASGSSASSPFRHTVHRNAVNDTVSPRQVLFHGSYMAHPESYTDDMSMFTFSDSENSMHSLPEPSMPSTHHRKTGQTTGTMSRTSQNHSFQQGRHPLPEGPGQSVARSQLGGLETYVQPLEGGPGQQVCSTGSQHEDSHPELTLRSNGPTSTTYANKPLRPSRSQSTSQAQTTTFDGPLHEVPTISMEAKPVFPPGRNMPGFVPIGRIGIANAAQGNRWPIERKLMEQIVGAERGHGEYRRKTRLTYKEIMAKYSRWDIKESTLRGIKRKITLPKEHRERKPRWDSEHINSLHRHVPTYTDKKGKVAWTKVVDAIRRDTGRPFGAGTASKKWTDIKKVQSLRGSIRDQQIQSGGEEEGHLEEGESSPSVPETAEVSEEDLPSHKFSFNGEGEEEEEEDDDDENLGRAGGFSSVNSSMSGYSQAWH